MLAVVKVCRMRNTAKFVAILTVRSGLIAVIYQYTVCQEVRLKDVV